MGRIARISNVLVVILILAGGAVLRSFMYGDLRLSIGTRDTISYISSSRAPLFSWGMFTGPRLFTTNLVYKMANGEGCELTAVSKPAEEAEEFRAIQPCFDRIALLQNMVSILCWSIFAWLFSRRLRNPFTKILSILLIQAFAFVPQIAEWDSVLGSESLTLSLLALSLGLLLELLSRITEEGAQLQPRTRFWLAAWALVFTLWVLVRDANLSAVPITIVMILVSLLFKPIRGSKPILATAALLFLLLVVGIVSTRQSPRTRFTLANSFNQYILPYPSRVAFFEKFGMPQSDTPEYQTWHEEKASMSYMLFLASHPGFVAQTMFNNIGYFTDAHTQHYYKSPELAYHGTLLTIGEFLHPKSSAVYLLDVVLFISICIAAIKRRGRDDSTWAWFAAWFFVTSAAGLLLNFFGDVSGALRHVFPSVAAFRLLFWLLPMIHMDLLLSQGDPRFHLQ